jgi:hypothetical protein
VKKLTYEQGLLRGSTAFFNRLPYAAALDAIVLREMTEAEVAIGEAVEYLRGWCDGWTRANLAALVQADPRTIP